MHLQRATVVQQPARTSPTLTLTVCSADVLSNEFIRVCEASHRQLRREIRIQSWTTIFRKRADDEAIEVQEQEEDAQRAYALGAAAEALEYVGLTGEADVKGVSQSHLGLAVTKQNLVFSLFMSTLDDVVTDAKATGEFEGSVEDVKATSITMKEAPTKIAADKSSGAATMLTKITLDRGISFEQVVGSIVDEEKESDHTEEDDENESVCC